MAKFNNSLLSDLRGKIGDLVFKNWRKVGYVSLRPTKYAVKKTPYSIKSKSDFKFSLGFSSALNKIEIFRKLWNSEERPANVMIMGSSLKILRNGGTFENLALLPAEGCFSPVLKYINYTNGILRIEFEPAGPSLNCHDKWISLQGVLCTENSQDVNIKPFSFLPIYGGEIAVDPSAEMIFEIRFTDTENNIINSYAVRKLLLNLITKERNGEVGIYSENIFGEI